MTWLHAFGLSSKHLSGSPRMPVARHGINIHKQLCCNLLEIIK